MNMASELIVDFPPRRNDVHVRFAKIAQLHIVHRHEDKNELWYTKAEYNSMKRNIKQDVLQARARDSASEEDSGFWIGIAHLLTPVCALEVKACRSRCYTQFSQSRQDRGEGASLHVGGLRILLLPLVS